MVRTQERQKTFKFQSKMPRKSHANRARAANLPQRDKIHLPKPTIEEVEDEGCRDDSECPRQGDIIGDDSDADSELLDIIGCLRGTAMVDDEDDRLRLRR
jgi:hypothetical protein